MELKRNDVIEIIDYLRNCISNDTDISSIVEINSGVSGVDLIYGVTNGFLSKLLETITGESICVIGEVEKLFTCSCCGYKTLTEKYDEDKGTGYCVCSYCGWEDDGTTNINEYRSINKGKIIDYREKIKKYKDKFYMEKWYSD